MDLGHFVPKQWIVHLLNQQLFWIKQIVCGLKSLFVNNKKTDSVINRFYFFGIHIYFFFSGGGPQFSDNDFASSIPNEAAILKSLQWLKSFESALANPLL